MTSENERLTKTFVLVQRLWFQLFLCRTSEIFVSRKHRGVSNPVAVVLLEQLPDVE